MSVSVSKKLMPAVFLMSALALTSVLKVANSHLAKWSGIHTPSRPLVVVGPEGLRAAPQSPGPR